MSRSVFLVYVVGASRVGKTAFLQSFLGRTIGDYDKDERFSQFAINSVQLRKQEIHVIVSASLFFIFFPHFFFQIPIFYFFIFLFDFFFFFVR